MVLQALTLVKNYCIGNQITTYPPKTGRSITFLNSELRDLLNMSFKKLEKSDKYQKYIS